MLTRLLDHPFWSGILGILAVVAHGFTVYTVCVDKNKVVLASGYYERNIIDVSLLTPSD